jgi:hypothetical protein
MPNYHTFLVPILSREQKSMAMEWPKAMLMERATVSAWAAAHKSSPQQPAAT